MIVYEDEHILVVNKPSGLLSVPGRLLQHNDSVWARLVQDPDIEGGYTVWISPPQADAARQRQTCRIGTALKKQFQYRFNAPKSTTLSAFGAMWEADEGGMIDLPLIVDWPIVR